MSNHFKKKRQRIREQDEIVNAGSNIEIDVGMSSNIPMVVDTNSLFGGRFRFIVCELTLDNITELTIDWSVILGNLFNVTVDPLIGGVTPYDDDVNSNNPDSHTFTPVSFALEQKTHSFIAEFTDTIGETVTYNVLLDTIDLSEGMTFFGFSPLDDITAVSEIAMLDSKILTTLDDEIFNFSKVSGEEYMYIIHPDILTTPVDFTVEPSGLPANWGHNKPLNILGTPYTIRRSPFKTFENIVDIKTNI